MKLFDYLDRLNFLRRKLENKQPILINTKVDLNRELYYDINIDVPGIKVEKSLKAKAPLRALKFLLSELKILLIEDDNEDLNITLKKKFRSQKKYQLNLMKTYDYTRLFSSDHKDFELGPDLQNLSNKYSYVAFFSDKELNSNENNYISFVLTDRITSETARNSISRSFNKNDSRNITVFDFAKNKYKNDYNLDLDDFSTPLTDTEILKKVEDKKDIIRRTKKQP